LQLKASPCNVSAVTARAGIRSITSSRRLRGLLATGYGLKRSFIAVAG
jgi:hypothetical protein